MLSLKKERRRQLAVTLVLMVLGIWGGAVLPTAAEEEHKEDQISLSRAEMEEFGIQVSEAGPGTIILTRNLPGEVKVNDTRLAHIVPRYTGIVTEVNANVGDQVTKGQILAVVESDETLAPYELKTFISGTIIHKHMTLGEPVSREDASFVVADLNTVWIDITVYQRDLNLIRVGEETTVRAGAEEKTVSGKISYVTPVVDEHTRTATARIVVDNTSGYWRPGMFVMAEIMTGEFEVGLVVPSTAVHTIEGRRVVFVEEDGAFHSRNVTIGRQGTSQLEILSGLDVGETYVSIGGFVMKAELGKDSLGEGHAH